MKTTLRQLQIFAQIAKHKQVSIAADTIHISQAAASMSLSQLEHQLGNTLFDREGKRLTLNTLGKSLLPKVNHILQQVDELENAANNPHTLSGHIDIGASTTIANYILPERLNRFRQQQPQISLALTVMNTDSCIQKLLNFDLDIALIEGICQHQDITLKPWQTDQLQVFCHPQHSLAKKKTVTPSDVKPYPWVLRESASGTRKTLDAALLQSSITLDKSMVINSSEAIKNWVCHNDQALACLSQATLAAEIKAKKLTVLQVKGWKLQRHFYQACYNKKTDSSLTKFVESFIRDGQA